MKRRVFLLTLITLLTAVTTGVFYTEPARAGGAVQIQVTCSAVQVEGNSDASPLTIIVTSGATTLAYQRLTWSTTIGTFNIVLTYSKEQKDQTPIRVRVTDLVSVLKDDVVPCSPTGIASSYVPDGFVQRTIICTTGVFDEPGGKAVEGAVIFSGQRWYVSPTTTTDKSGQKWTAIYVSSAILPFIPSSCIASN